MFNRGRVLLGITVALFAWGMLSLFEARFESGDLYPMGSSLRSDALGLRAIRDALAEAFPKSIESHRGRIGHLKKATNATIIVPHLSFMQLVVKGEPLIDELTTAMRGGARVVVSLDDRESRVCRKTYCNEEKRTRCHGIRDLEIDEPKPSAAPAPSSLPPQAPPEDTSCSDAALGLWGFEVGGTMTMPTTIAERAEAAPTQLPLQLPWHSPAKFIELAPEFKTLYERAGGALVVERSFGKGSLVLLGETYLLSNEAQRRDRFPELLLWLVGDKSRVIFEESHLGVVEPRGIVSLLRDLGLHGFLVGCLVFASMLAWQRMRPLSRRSERRPTLAGNQVVSDSTVLALLRRSMNPNRAFAACVEEAKHAKLVSIVERAEHGNWQPTASDFNRIFCPEQERPDSG